MAALHSVRAGHLELRCEKVIPRLPNGWIKLHIRPIANQLGFIAAWDSSKRRGGFTDEQLLRADAFQRDPRSEHEPW